VTLCRRIKTHIIRYHTRNRMQTPQIKLTFTSKWMPRQCTDNFDPTYAQEVIRLSYTTHQWGQSVRCEFIQASVKIKSQSHVTSDGQSVPVSSPIWGAWQTNKQPKTKQKKRGLVRKRTIPSVWPPLVGEVSANFAYRRMSRSQRGGSPMIVISVF
jgi:hypothetical protein